MSRIFAPNRFRFLLGLLSWAMLIAVGLDVQESRAQELIPTSTAPTGFLPKGQPFLSLLDDVTVEDRTGYFSNEAQCQLNAPLTPQAEVIDQAPPEASYDWAALLTYSCGNMACDDMACGNCSTYIFTNDDDPASYGNKSCNWESDLSSGYPERFSLFYNDQTPKRKTEDYCDQIAKLLATTLHNSQASPDAKNCAIRSAMGMVEEKMSADAALKISELKAAHQLEINQLQRQLLSASDNTESIAQIMSWLRPVYSNQNRTDRQLRRPFNVSAMRPENDLSKLESTGMDDTNPITNRRLLPSSAQMANKLMAEQRQSEIARLRKELAIIDARLSRLVKKPSQRDSQLEPVYVPNQQLVPLHDLPQRRARFEDPESSLRYR